MKSIDSFYSSITDSWWFSGNPNLNEKKGFTWFINSTGFQPSPGYWKMCVSAPGTTYVLPAGCDAANLWNNKKSILVTS